MVHAPAVDHAPDHVLLPTGNDYFGSVSDSLWTMLQIMSFDSWSSAIGRPISIAAGWYGWAYFLIAVFVFAFTLAQVFAGIVIEAMFRVNKDREDEKTMLSDLVQRELEEARRQSKRK